MWTCEFEIDQSPSEPKTQLYNNFYQHPVGDKNKNNGMETQFLLETGATCSLIKFGSYEKYCKIQPLQLNKSRSNTVAVNREKIKLIVYTIFDSIFGTKTDYPMKIKEWISAKDGCNLKVLGMYFISQLIKSINFLNSKLPRYNSSYQYYKNQKLSISELLSKCTSWLKI